MTRSARRNRKKEVKKERKDRKRRQGIYMPKKNRRSSKKYRIMRVIFVMLCLGIVGIAGLFGINAYVKHCASDRIITPEAAAELQGADCILVLGCLVKEGGEPSHMLEDRLRRGVELYEAGAAPKLLMSGDHGRKDYNEVEAMKQYAMECGIPSEDVFMDHAGFSTYDSCYRAKEIFGAKKIIIVTQGYHLYRALFIAEKLGMDAYGVASDYRTYFNQTTRDVREVLARVKDFMYVLFRPEPTYLGEIIPISGSGDATNDK